MPLKWRYLKVTSLALSYCPTVTFVQNIHFSAFKLLPILQHFKLLYAKGLMVRWMALIVRL